MEIEERKEMRKKVSCSNLQTETNKDKQISKQENYNLNIQTGTILISETNECYLLIDNPFNSV